jgi:hypothetical protein
LPECVYGIPGDFFLKDRTAARQQSIQCTSASYAEKLIVLYKKKRAPFPKKKSKIFQKNPRKRAENYFLRKYNLYENRKILQPNYAEKSDTMPDEKLRNFFNFLKSRTDPDEDSAFVQKLKDLVDESNEKEDVRKRKMTLEYEINEAAQERAKEMADTIVAERVEDDRLETARNMLNRGFSPDLVADCTRLSPEQVERLKESL